MIRRLVNQISSFEYEQIVFIILAGLFVVGLTIGLAYWLTRKLPSPHDQ